MVDGFLVWKALLLAVGAQRVRLLLLLCWDGRGEQKKDDERSRKWDCVDENVLLVLSPILLDGEAVVELQVGDIVVIDELDGGLVGTTSEHSRGSLLPAVARPDNLVGGLLRRVRSEHQILLGD